MRQFLFILLLLLPFAGLQGDIVRNPGPVFDPEKIAAFTCDCLAGRQPFNALAKPLGYSAEKGRQDRNPRYWQKALDNLVPGKPVRYQQLGITYEYENETRMDINMLFHGDIVSSGRNLRVRIIMVRTGKTWRLERLNVST